METNINCLPNEILIKIITKLSVFERIKCEKVCIRWKQLASIFMEDIKALNFGHHLSICNDSNHKVFDSSNLINAYELSFNYLFESKLIEYVLSFTPKLKCLNLYVRNDQTIDIIMKNCTEIECLTLVSYSEGATLKAIPMISKLGNTLRHLKISDESRVIKRNSLEDLMIGMLSECPRLQIFHLFRIQLNAKSCQVICQNLREISTQMGCGSIQALIKTKIVENLENLIIRESFINSNRMRTICDSFLNLKKLYVESYSDCDDFTYFSLIARMRRLEHLEINFIPKLYNQFVCIDNYLSQIFENCKNLTKISFSCCLNVSITNDCLVKISSNCARIKYIHFWKFGDMTKVNLDAIRTLVTSTNINSLTLDALHYNVNRNDLNTFFPQLFEMNSNLKFLFLFVTQMTRI